MDKLISFLNHQPFGCTDDVMDPAGIRILHLILMGVVAMLIYTTQKGARNEQE